MNVRIFDNDIKLRVFEPQKTATILCKKVAASFNTEELYPNLKVTIFTVHTHCIFQWQFAQ